MWVALILLFPVLIQGKSEMGWYILGSLPVVSHLIILIFVAFMVLIEQFVPLIGKNTVIGGPFRAFLSVALLLFLMGYGNWNFIPDFVMAISIVVFAVVMAYVIAGLLLFVLFSAYLYKNRAWDNTCLSSWRV